MALISMTTEPKSPTNVFYDPAAGVNLSGDVETSVTVRQPLILQGDDLVSGTNFEIEVKINNDADWVLHTAVTGATAVSQMFIMDAAYNFVRVIRTLGTADPVWYTQESTRHETY